MEALETGKIIAERYRVVSFLAKGGMGAVYEVEHVHTGERLALKLLFASLDEEALSRFKREASVAARIKSEHVVRVTDAGVAPDLGGVAFLVMDLLEGADLEETCGDAPQAPDQVVGWLRDVAQGLARAHELGLVHRDLKPQNLFLTKRPDGSPLVKILDFGIVKHAELDATPTLTGRILGTPMYMAPEQAHVGQLPITKSADLYSLGLVAFRLLSGMNYRRGDTMVKVLGEVLAAVVVPPSERGLSLGPRFDEWFKKACAVVPADRFTSAPLEVEALAEALGIPPRSSVSAASSAAPPARPSPSLPVNDTFTSAPTAVMDARPRRSRKLGPLIAVATMLLAGAVLALGPWLRKSPSVTSPPDASASTAVGTGIADGPMSETKSDAARAHLREGMRLLSLASPFARQSLDAALREDPDFASAHLQRAILDRMMDHVVFDNDWSAPTADEGRLDLRAVAPSRATLPPRDQALLSVVEQLWRDPPDFAAAEKALDESARRFPADAELAFVGGIVEHGLIHGPEMFAWFARTAALDPQEILSLFVAAALESDAKFAIGMTNVANARRDAAACRARAPESIPCRIPAVWLDLMDGRCAEAERGAREMTAIAPDDANGFWLRADALAGQNAPLTAIAELVEKSLARSPAHALAENGRALQRDQLLWTGNLAGARILAQRARIEAPESDRSFWFTYEIAMALESGDSRAAADLALQALSSAGAMLAEDGVHDSSTVAWLRIAYEGKLLSRADYTTRREAWLEGWRSRMDARAWNTTARVAALNAYAPLGATLDRAEAEETATKLRLPDSTDATWGLTPGAPELGALGVLLSEAGYIDEAITVLEAATKNCSFTIWFQMRPTLALGRARALKGDRAGACKAFEKVLLRWGHAKPRSVTAEKARAEAAKLGCDPVP